LDGPRSDGRQECLGDRGFGQRGPEVRDVGTDRLVAHVRERTDADGFASGEIAAPGEVLGELGGVAAVDLRQRTLTGSEGALLDAAQPLARVTREVSLGLLA